MILWRPVARRAILMAFSFASAPPSVKNVFFRSPGVISASISPRIPRTSVAWYGDTYGSLAAWSWMALMTRRSPWPMFTFMSCELKSR